MLEIHLYGRLRRHGPTADPTVPCILRVEADSSHTAVGDLVAALGIPAGEVASVFRDGRWQRDGLKAPLEGAARLGLFPREMSLLYV